MTPKAVYLCLCALGTAVPCSQLLPFLSEHGLDPRLFVEQLFATPISRFFGMDVLVSALVLWTFVVVESRRAHMKHRWAPVAASLAVGVSLGLPLFLYMRETNLERERWTKRRALEP
jgi:hypothetical protein